MGNQDIIPLAFINMSQSCSNALHSLNRSENQLWSTSANHVDFAGDFSDLAADSRDCVRNIRLRVDNIPKNCFRGCKEVIEEWRGAVHHCTASVSAVTNAGPKEGRRSNRTRTNPNRRRRVVMREVIT